MNRLVARLAWVLPLFFLGLTVHQANVALDIRKTLDRGTLATAEVTEVHEENRVDVTFDWVSLRVPLEDGSVMVKDKLALPHSLVPLLKTEDDEPRETVDVRVDPGADQEVVILSVASTQWRIAAMNSAIGGVAFLIFAVGVFYWNRSLETDGDPAERGVSEPDPDHPARRVMREA